jgi:hypothetical protein
MTNQRSPNLRPIPVGYHYMMVVSYQLGEFSRCGPDVSVLFLEGTVLTTLENRVTAECHYCDGLSV